jgi:hypothetical protein
MRIFAPWAAMALELASDPACYVANRSPTGVRQQIERQRAVKQRVDDMKIPEQAYAALAVLFLATGCGKVNVENYDKLKIAMSYEEVKAILGAPDRCSDAPALKSCVWGDDKRHIDVNFLGDKVVTFGADGIR